MLILISYIGLVLIWIEAILGLKINLGKSKLVPVGAVPNIEELVDVLGCKWWVCLQ